MKIKNAELGDLNELAEIYKNSFEVHNIFSKPIEEINDYLLSKMNEGKIICILDEKIVGGCYVVKEENWRIKHFAIKEEFWNKGYGKELLKKAEQKCDGVIEIHVSQNEMDALYFYEKEGYTVIDQLPDYYREKECVFVLQKEVENARS